MTLINDLVDGQALVVDRRKGPYWDGNGHTHELFGPHNRSAVFNNINELTQGMFEWVMDKDKESSCDSTGG